MGGERRCRHDDKKIFGNGLGGKHVIHDELYHGGGGNYGKT